MASTILTIVAAIVSFAIWWAKRRAESKADPLQQHRDSYQQIDAAIAQGDDRGGFAADLDELERLQRAQGARDSRGSKPQPD